MHVSIYVSMYICSCCDLAFGPNSNVVLTVLDQSQTSYWTPDLFATDSTELSCTVQITVNINSNKPQLCTHAHTIKHNNYSILHPSPLRQNKYMHTLSSSH